MRRNDNNVNPWFMGAYIGGAGVMLAVYIVAGYWGSKWLAEWLDGPRYWIAIGTIIGLLLGIANLFILIYKVVGEKDG